jgi:hypothetical protein
MVFDEFIALQEGLESILKSVIFNKMWKIEDNSNLEIKLFYL